MKHNSPAPNPVPKGAAAQEETVVVKQARAKPVFRRSHGVTSAQLAELQTRFPGWDFEFGNGSLHPHPIGASERAICETMLYEEICRIYGRQTSITDIGGNANRHASSGRLNVHSCNPVLSAADAVRRRPESYLASAQYCDRRSQECQLTPDVYLAIHSLYYLTKDEILQHVQRARKKCLYALCHSFGSLYGGFHVVDHVPESTYEVACQDDEMRVHMKVHGNHTGYTHSACLWLHETNYYEKNGEAMAWTSTPVGDSYTYVFTSAPIGLTPERSTDMSLCDSLNRSDYYGKLDGLMAHGDQCEFRPTLQKLKLVTGRNISCGPFTAMVMQQSQRTVLVPKDIVVYVGNTMVGLERNDKTLTTCINRMRSALKRFNVPESMKSVCLTYGSALAFVYSLQDEIYAFNDLCKGRFQRFYGQLRGALSLSPLGCCGVSTIARFEEEQSHMNALTAVTQYSMTRTTEAQHGRFNARDAWPDGLPGVECRLELRPMKKGAKIREFDCDDGEREFKPQLQVNCPIFTPIQVVVPNPSKENERRALLNRALVATPLEDDTLWAEVHKNARRQVKLFDRVDGEYDDLFLAWNAKFPNDRQKKHLIAYANVLKRGLERSDMIMKMFIKREVTLKTGSEFEDFDPRAIQGCTDEMNVSYGPFIWAASKILCREWNTDNRICYTSGLTAEQIGLWRAQFDDVPDVTIIELDESRYDAHQGRGMHGCAAILKNATGIRNYDLPFQVEKASYEKTGKSKYFAYTVPGTMTSGKADTSFSNSFGNGVKLDTLLQSFGLKTDQYRMLVNGDDSLVVIDHSMGAAREAALREHLVVENKKLGFTTKCKVLHEWSDAEYCSGLFWPVKGGYVLGPKIGKRLPKLGFGVKQLTNAEIQSMIVGMEADLAHLPVLGVYVEACKNMSKQLHVKEKHKTKQYVDKEAQYKNHCTCKHRRTAQTDIFFMARYGVSAQICEKSLGFTLEDMVTITDCVHYPMMNVFARDL